jgi:hypothetical protein
MNSKLLDPSGTNAYYNSSAQRSPGNCDFSFLPVPPHNFESELKFAPNSLNYFLQKVKKISYWTKDSKLGEWAEHLKKILYRDKCVWDKGKLIGLGFWEGSLFP